MKNKYISVILTALLFVTLTVGSAWAVPKKINYQGKLTDSGGDPVTGSISMEFAIYDVDVGGSALWSSGALLVSLSDEGIYNVILGDGTPINLPFDVPYYLGVTVDTDAEMIPRQELSSVGYAYNAETLDGHPVSDFAVSSHDHDAEYVNEGQVNSITSVMITDSNVTLNDLAANSVNSSKVVDNSLTAADLAPESVGSSEIADGAVTSVDVADNSLTAADLAPDSVGASEIATGAVGTSEVLDNSLTASDLAAGSVGSSEVSDNSLTAADLATGSVASAEVLDNSLTAADLAAGSVGSSEIADGSILQTDLAASLYDDFVNTTGDTMSGALSMVTNGSSIFVDANPATTTMYGVYVDADQTNNNYIYGLYSDTDSSAATSAYTYGAYSNANGNYVTYGLYSYGRSTTSTAYGLYGSSYADGGISYGLRLNASQASGNNSSVYGQYLTSYAYGTGELKASYNYASHNGTAGDTYSVHARAYGSDAGISYGIYAQAENGVDNYAGYFTSVNANAHGVYATVSGTTARAVEGYATNSGTITNYGGYFEASGAYGRGVEGHATNTGDYTNYGGRFQADGTYGIGVYGYSPDYYGVYGYGGSRGVYGYTSGSASDYASGVYGYASSGAQYGYGGYFYAAGSGAVGIRAYGGSGYAADFYGKVRIRTTGGTMVMELGDGLDYAEGFDVSEMDKVLAGSVLIIDPENPGKLKLSNSPYDTKVAGIAAGANGLGTGVRLGADRFDTDVALAGRVYCNVDATEEGIGQVICSQPQLCRDMP